MTQIEVLNKINILQIYYIRIYRIFKKNQEVTQHLVFCDVIQMFMFVKKKVTPFTYVGMSV